jgi:hypothetical protein
MLNRLITYIQEVNSIRQFLLNNNNNILLKNEKRFSAIHSHIRLYMKRSLEDQQSNQDIQYPEVKLICSVDINIYIFQ